MVWKGTRWKLKKINFGIFSFNSVPLLLNKMFYCNHQDFSDAGNRLDYYCDPCIFPPITMPEINRYYYQVKCA